MKDEKEWGYIGIDGEGQGRNDHKYTMMCASDGTGQLQWILEPTSKPDRLTTKECLGFITRLAHRNTRVFSYSFNYDMTMMLRQLPNGKLYDLFRPDRRKNPYKGAAKYSGPVPVQWEGWNLNLQGTKFTVQGHGKKVVVWDLFKFFGTSFVNALKDWKVGDPERVKWMAYMKAHRAEFDKLSSKDVKEYCLLECQYMALLGQKLVEAHDGAGLKLKSFYGAGSSGAAILESINIREKMADCPESMIIPVATAFSGGRFEYSAIGEFEEKLFNWDISSAYPYQLTFLPCLQHGTWTHTRSRNDIEKAECQQGALVRYKLHEPGKKLSWGPFPFRDRDGNISYPERSGGGWVWRDEFLQGERLWPNVQFQEAYVYSSNCDCKPFERIPEFYLFRLRVGKEGPGLSVKLGINSAYGKLAQSVGSARYNSWIWAGMITSGCRAQILELMGRHKDMSNVLGIATDGLLTREEIVPPYPLPTGTGAIIHGQSKPLGGWELKVEKKGMFLARPGVYFPLNPTEEELSKIRARGIGRAAMLANWENLIHAWRAHGVNGIAEMSKVSRFCGAKSSISKGIRGYVRADGDIGNKEPAYGQWVERDIRLSFDPMPKRAGLNPDGRTLAMRKFDMQERSAPYNRALLRMASKYAATTQDSEENLQFRAVKEELLEQPDGDYSQY